MTNRRVSPNAGVVTSSGEKPMGGETEIPVISSLSDGRLQDEDVPLHKTRTRIMTYGIFLPDATLTRANVLNMGQDNGPLTFEQLQGLAHMLASRSSGNTYQHANVLVATRVVSGPKELIAANIDAWQLGVVITSIEVMPVREEDRFVRLQIKGYLAARNFLGISEGFTLRYFLGATTVATGHFGVLALDDTVMAGIAAGLE